MSLLNLKFKEDDFAGKDVASLPDAPSAMGMSASELKARFDMVPKILIAMGAFNNLVDELDTNGVEALHLELELTPIKDRISSLENAEGSRAQAELDRITDELQRISNENTRISNENARVSTESSRAGAEILREQNEITRKSSEITRSNAEIVREQQEANRQSNENARQSKTTDFEVWEDYNPEKTYKTLNKVAYQGSSFVCKETCMGIPPSDGQYWLLVASKGLDGEGSGDMLKMVYDMDDNGNVDLADDSLKLGGISASSYVTVDNISPLVNGKIDKTAIVNDLTTGGATNVLSAEQGKIISLNVDGVGDGVNVISNKIGNPGDATPDTLFGAIKSSATALAQIITTPNGNVTVSQGAKSYTKQANSLGIAEFELSLGFWDVVANASYKILIEQTGKLYTLTSGDKLKLNDCSWGLIDLLGKQNLLQQYFSLGDWKQVDIKGETIKLQIIGFNHDNLATSGKAKMTLGMVDALNNMRRMEATGINTNSWSGSEMRSWVSTSLLDDLPTDLKNAIKPVKKLTATNGNTAALITTTDSLFLLSQIEVGGGTANSQPGEGTKYAFFTDNQSRIKSVKGTANNWWLRSPSLGLTTGFVLVGNSGTFYYNGANNTLGVVVGLCI